MGGLRVVQVVLAWARSSGADSDGDPPPQRRARARDRAKRQQRQPPPAQEHGDLPSPGRIPAYRGGQ